LSSLLQSARIERSSRRRVVNLVSDEKGVHFINKKKKNAKRQRESGPKHRKHTRE
jgi:hypothetical protein